MSIDWGHISEAMLAGFIVLFVGGVLGLVGWSMYMSLRAEFGSHMELLIAIGQAIVGFVLIVALILCVGFVTLRVIESIGVLRNRRN